MQGKIIKGIAGFYYVLIKDRGIYECKAKGIFRKENLKPLVGDDVEIEILDEEQKKGNIADILPRQNQLIRPAVANIDQALVIFAVSQPEPNLSLLDRFLLMMEWQQLPCSICFNKDDIASEEARGRLGRIYGSAGYGVLFISAREQTGIEEVKKLLHGRTTTVAGPSGVGKSSVINCLQSEVCMETGTISEKIQRGKHTTRHSELILIDEDTYIMDTPGFSSLSIPEVDEAELWTLYPEFAVYEKNCKFVGCMHMNEPVCGIKQAVEKGYISQERYESYTMLYRELKEKKKY